MNTSGAVHQQTPPMTDEEIEIEKAKQESLKDHQQQQQQYYDCSDDSQRNGFSFLQFMFQNQQTQPEPQQQQDPQTSHCSTQFQSQRCQTHPQICGCEQRQGYQCLHCAYQCKYHCQCPNCNYIGQLFCFPQQNPSFFPSQQQLTPVFPFGDILRFVSQMLDCADSECQETLDSVMKRFFEVIKGSEQTPKDLEENIGLLKNCFSDICNQKLSEKQCKAGLSPVASRKMHDERLENGSIKHTEIRQIGERKLIAVTIIHSDCTQETQKAKENINDEEVESFVSEWEAILKLE